jgi:SAM-dependent methyltransferase
MTELDRNFGRRAFGSDPANYDAARPDYPDWVFETLRAHCGLAPGAAVFEIGSGTGKATRQLLARGAAPLVAIEPDPRLAAHLRRTINNQVLQVLAEPFEEAVLEQAGFDLGLAATSFHWLEEAAALAKVARLLKPGGWWAALWNVFGDDSYPDPFHEATVGSLDGPNVPYALDARSRIAAIDATGAFERVLYRTDHWPLVLTAEQTVALYASYSNIAAREDRVDVLAELRRIAEEEFGGRVTRNMTTILYLARRKS